MNNKFKIDESLIIDLVGINNYIEGLKIDPNNIENDYFSKEYGYLRADQIIKDEDNEYNINILIYEGSIRRACCDCENFQNYNRCKHVAASFNNLFEIINKSENLTPSAYYSSLVKKYVKPKKIETLDLEIIVDTTLGVPSIKFKIGNEKKYIVTNKLSQFISVFRKNRKTVILGKYLTYDSSKQNFSKSDEAIISFLISCYLADSSNYDNSVPMSKSNLQILLNLMGEKEYSINTQNKKYRAAGYETALPYNLSLTEENSLFNFKFDFKDMEFLTDDKCLAYYNNKLYILPEDHSNFLISILGDGVKDISLDKKTATAFSKKVSPLLKENYIIEDKLKEEFEIIIPKVKLFFDFNSNIIAKVIFDYKGKEINYFDKKEAYRNVEVEESVIEDLLVYNFIDKKDHYLMEDIDSQVDFIDKDIFKLKSKYDIYTTEKFDNVSVLKSTSISSQFSIGKDNILSYKFETGDISPKELNKIFKSMNEKKKYFKLKSGKILSTDDEKLNELKRLCDNLNLDSYDNEGVIPKYRALYLDSVKDYKIVSTDNLFDKFVKNFNENKNANIILNEKDKNTLRDYQLVGTKWLYNIYKCGFGGILADEMGLGKTVQTIMFLKNVLKDKPDAKILVVAPTSLIYNWEHEFDVFASELKYRVLAQNRNKREESLNNFSDNVIITTYGLIRQDADLYSKIDFEVIIVDEAQNIKNPKAGISLALKMLKSNSKIALTGTPVENSVIEVWSIFDFLMPGYLNTLNNFQSRYNVKNMGEDAREVLSDLNKMISPFILRRKKKDVLTDLPDKFENNIYLDLLPEQKKYYMAQVKKSKEEFEDLVAKEGFLKARFKILQLLTKLRQICIDPKIVFDSFDDESVKMVEIINLINQYTENGHKLLVFSTFKTALDILKVKLDDEGISSYVIDGSVSSKNRKTLVDAFNKDNTNVFLITLKAGGTGLNLTGADVVVHLDLWWNPQAENQATDRAHRIGQKNKVEVIKLVCKGTIEEKIIELQEKKKILNDALIENGELNESALNKLDENDIKNLLSLSE